MSDPRRTMQARMQTPNLSLVVATDDDDDGDDDSLIAALCTVGLQ